ncbi:molybdenum cofactor biosynthesis protein MoaE [Robertkochia flava]|uniref:molybdenum cofactor biosynthesis protein MoaE n=1 Tax=Robertkochia flava TaxID=3447986 RepID=UPI001CCCB99D|nr:molybdenum cofactor biosynthesis protein MoaE [Robertkochia marina]
MGKKIDKVFFEGAIPATFLAEVIDKHRTKTGIGAHNIFMGQVRADEMDGKEVAAIEFSSYTSMAHEKLSEIREAAFEKYPLHCLHIYHSLGRVNAGEICFVVFASAERRKMIYQATEEIVNRVKSEVPIFGKEIFADESHAWKVNTD